MDSRAGSRGNLCVGTPALASGLQVLSGQTWHFRGGFRDDVGGNSTDHTTDAVTVP